MVKEGYIDKNAQIRVKMWLKFIKNGIKIRVTINFDLLNFLLKV